MKRAAVIGCGALGTILVTNFARAEGWTLTGVMARTKAHAEALAANAGCRAATTLEELLADKPDLVVEIAGIGAAKAYGEAVLEAGCDFVLVSAGALADADWKARMTETALRTGRRIHVASGAIGGFDVLQTVTLMAQAQGLPETAGIETHTGAKGFRNTPVWAEHLLTDTEKTTVFTGNAKQAIATFPRRVNVAVATSLATTGPEITGVTMHSVPGWVGDDHCITAEIEGVKAVVDICSSTSAIAGWSAVSLLRNLASPVCFY